MGKILYNVGVRSFYMGVRIASLFNEKAQYWIEGRKQWRENLKKAASKLDSGRRNVWFHVSSLGEFEQGRPVMEELKKTKDINLILSFYSPSGYEQMKDWQVADLVTYLPLDTKKNAIDFIDIIKPDLALFVKYDLWFHYLSQLRKKKLPSLLISARFYPSQAFFKSWASWYRDLLFLFDRILVQDHESLDLLHSINYNDAEISGDIRYDRVDELSKNKDRFNEIEKFVDRKKVFIAGSSWPLDEDVFIPYLLTNEKNLCSIIAPHDIGKKHIDSLVLKCKGKSILHSNIENWNGEKILIIDSIGILSRIYKYADISYIGGAFKEGLHNILEPAAFGVPVITGPDHKGFPEGPQMEKEGGLFRVEDDKKFAIILDQLLDDEKAYSLASHSAIRFIKERKGASKRTLEAIEQYF